MNKQYLGDGVYVEFVDSMLKLSTQRLEHECFIYLEEELYRALVKYVNTQVERDAP
jgi:hypothetical protein